MVLLDEYTSSYYSVFVGIASSLSAWYTVRQSEGITEECISAAVTAFISCGGITYLGSYVDFSMLAAMAEAAAVFDINILSSFLATALSFSVDPVSDKIATSLTYVPEYYHTYYNHRSPQKRLF